MEDDKIKALYEQMRGDGYELDDEATFRNDLQNDASFRETIYNAQKDSGYDMGGDFDAWQGRLMQSFAGYGTNSGAAAAPKTMSPQEYAGLSAVGKEVADGAGVQVSEKQLTNEERQAEWERKQHEYAVAGAEMRRKAAGAPRPEKPKPTLEERKAYQDEMVADAYRNIDKPGVYVINPDEADKKTIIVNTKDYTDRIVGKLFADADKKVQEMSAASTDYSAWGATDDISAMQNARKANEVLDPEAIKKQALEYLKKDEEAIKLRAAANARDLQAKTDRYINVEDYVNYVYNRTVIDTLAKVDYIATQRMKPKTAAEGVLGGMMDGITGSIVDAAINTPGNVKARQRGAEEWGQDAGMWGRVGRSAVSFAADIPFLELTGGFSQAVLERRTAAKMAELMEQGLTKKAAGNVVREQIGKSLGKRVADETMNHVIAGASNLGAYEGMAEAARQAATGEFSPKDILGAAAHGAMMGGTLGVTGGPWEAVTSKMGGAKKILANIAGFGIEAGTFTATGELEKWATGNADKIDWGEDFLESASMLVGMKFPKGFIKMFDPSKRPERFNAAESRELKGSPEGAELMNAIEGKGGMSVEEAYGNVMKSKDISFVTKQKLAYMLTRMMVSKTPAVVGYDIEDIGGRTYLSTKSAGGDVVERIEFENRKEAEDYGKRMDAAIERGALARNFSYAVQQAKNEVAREWGFLDESKGRKERMKSLERFNEIMSKPNDAEPPTEEEMSLITDEDIDLVRRGGSTGDRIKDDIAREWLDYQQTQQVKQAVVDRSYELTDGDRWTGKRLDGESAKLLDETGGVDEAKRAQEMAMQETNSAFNELLSDFSEENADSKIFSLGQPSAILVAAGVEDKPIKLYGSKIQKKIKKHGFSAHELRDLPQAVSDPIAVFNNYERKGNRSILTELRTRDGNFLVTIDLGKGELDADFNLVSSVFGKEGNKILNWINNGFATYINKEKALDYLHLSAPIAEASDNQELYSAAKIVENFENPKISDEILQNAGNDPKMHNDGTYHKATMYPDASNPDVKREVFVTGDSKLVKREDGSIDVEASDKMIYYIGEDGQKHVDHPNKFMSAEDPVTAEEMNAAGEAGQTGGLLVEPGTELAAKDGNGTVSIDNVNPDGTYNVTVIDNTTGEEEPLNGITYDELMGLVGEQELARLNETSTEDVPVFGELEGTGGDATAEEPQPVGQNRFGNIYDQFKGKVKAAVDFLRSKKEGVAKGALHHNAIGDIDLVWGDASHGLAHIESKHPGISDSLQERIDEMNVSSISDNRIILESDTHKAVISKDWLGKPVENWLLTAYEKKMKGNSGGSIDIVPEPEGKQNGTAPLQESLYSKPVSASSSDIETEPEGKQNGTATLQSGLSADKGTENIGNDQGYAEENIHQDSNNEGKNTQNSYVGRSLSAEEAEGMVSKMEAQVEDAPDVPLNETTWNEQFPNGEVETPIGKAKFGENQLAKLFLKGREKEFGMLRPTLTNPDIVVEEDSQAVEGNAERNSSYLFVKTFNYGGEKVKFYTSVTVKKDGMEVIISNHITGRNAINKKMQNGKILHLNNKFAPSSSDGHLAENQNGLPDLLPTQGANVSADKGTENIGNDQGYAEENAARTPAQMELDTMLEEYGDEKDGGILAARNDISQTISGVTKRLNKAKEAMRKPIDRTDERQVKARQKAREEYNQLQTTLEHWRNVSQELSVRTNEAQRLAEMEAARKRAEEKAAAERERAERLLAEKKAQHEEEQRKAQEEKEASMLLPDGLPRDAEIEDTLDREAERADGETDRGVAVTQAVEYINTRFHLQGAEWFVNEKIKNAASDGARAFWESVKAEQERITSPEAERDVITAEPERGISTKELNRYLVDGDASARAIAASALRSGGLDRESIRNSLGIENADMQGYSFLTSNNGRTIESIAHSLWEQYPEKFGTDADAAEMLRDVLGEVKTTGDFRRIIEEEIRKTDLTADEADMMEQQRQAAVEDIYGMPYADVVAYEEMMIPEIIRKYAGLDENELIKLLNETDNEYSTESETGDSVLPETQASYTARRGTGEEGREVEGTGGEGTVEDGRASQERGRREDNGYSGERQGGLAKAEEIDENGHPFAVSSDDTSVFGEIREDSGLKAAPIKLSTGFNKVDEAGNNVGYGLEHIKAGHGNQILAAGYSSIEAFVEDVAKNYGEIRIGKDRKSNKTYMLLEVQDEKHNRTLYIELSHDGNYWNVNSGGIFKKKYTDKNDIVWPGPTVGSNASTDATEVADSPTEAAVGEAVDRGGNSSQPISFDGKGTKLSANEQEKWEENVEDALTVSGNNSVSLQSETKANDYERNLESRQRERETRSILEAAGKTESDGSGGDSPAAQDGQGGRSRESLLGELAERASGSPEWIDDISELVSSPIGKGGENEVYLSRDGQSVIKVNDFSFLPEDSKDFDGFLNRIDTHNELFPDAPLRMVGFANNSDGNVSVVMEQPFFDGMREATDEEIDAYLESHDFYTDISGNWTNGDIVIADAKPNNVLVDGDGNMYFIDTLPYDYRRKGDRLVPKREGTNVQKEAGGVHKPTKGERAVGEVVASVVRDAGIDVVTDADEMRKVLEDSAGRVQEMAVEEASARFDRQLDDFKAKTQKGLMNLGRPKAKLLAAGIDDVELTLDPGVLHRHLEKHGLNVEDLKGLAAAIQDPILVYKHGKEIANKVIVTELDAKGGKLSISLKLDDSGRVVEINNVRSVHAKDATKELERLAEFSEDELKESLGWVEYNKVSDWFNAAGLSVLLHDNTNPKLNSIANVLQNFENPKVSDEILKKNIFSSQLPLGHSSELDGSRLPVALQKMTVWHGSPYSFEAFDHANMGKGEGAQAHGWGTYVTKEENTGRHYAAQNDGSAEYRFVGDESLKYLADEVIMTANANREPIAKVLRGMKEAYSDDADVLSDLEKLNVDDFKPNRGHLYEVEIPEDDGKNYLDEQKEVSETELEEITEGLLLRDDFNDYALDKIGQYQEEYELDGGALYRILQKWGFDGDGEATSKALSGLGFAGIKYNGRQDGECYVVFNEADAKIVNHTQFLKTPGGDVYGFVKDGKMYLDMDMINPNTPIHEYGHLWDNALMKTQPEMWEQWKDLVRGSGVWNEVVNDPNYADIAHDENLVASEVKSRLTGKEGEERLKRMADDIDMTGNPMDVAKDLTFIQKVKDALKRMWEATKDWLLESNVFKDRFTTEQIKGMSVEDFVNKTLKDLAEGVNPAKEARRVDGETDRGVTWKDMQDDARFRFIGEKGAENADKAEGVTTRMDNLKVAREMERAHNEKKAQIEKLRKSEPVEISGDEIEASDDLKQYKKNALEYGKILQGSYTNKDTGRTIQLQRGRKNGGLKEVLQHDMNDVAHIKSVAAIPQIIENAIYIDSMPNEDSTKNPDVARYHYYVCGMKIGGEDYTVRMVEAEDMRGNRYYDHKLTHIEKGKLLDELALVPSSTELSSTPGSGAATRNRPTNRRETSDTPVSVGKDTKLLSILQTNEEEIAKRIKLATGWERGKDGKWRYEEARRVDGETDRGVAWKDMQDCVRFRFIGEKGAENADKAEGVTTRMDNLKVAGEMERAHNEKKEWIEKLRGSEPVSVKYEGQYELNRDSAKQWMKDNLRGVYTNADTGERIEVGRIGIKEVTSHGAFNEAHLKSLSAIPQMIEGSVFIDELPNTKGNDKFDVYRYYACGLEIDGEPYTAKIVVGVKDGKRYYDHRLTQIEKGTLLDNLSGLSNTAADKQNTLVSVGKDTKLLSILQTNEEEIAKRIKLATGWERGKDGKWRYEEARRVDGETDRGVATIETQEKPVPKRGEGPLEYAQKMAEWRDAMMTNKLLSRMDAKAEEAPELELSPENWTAEFGEDGKVLTPVGEVKMGENQYLKLLKRNRQEYFGMIKPTLTSPDIVLEEHDPVDGAERDSKYLFVKTFRKPDGGRIVHFESVTVKRDNLEVSISSHELEGDAVKRKVQQDKLLYLDEKFSSSEGRLAEPLEEGSDLVPTPNFMGSALNNTTDTVETLSGNGNDTATPENTVSSGAKVRKKYENPNVSRANILPEDDIMASGGGASGTTPKPVPLPGERTIDYARRMTEWRNSMMTDKQGNPVDKDGRLLLEDVASMDELTDKDFTEPTRNVRLPKIPENVDNAIGANGKPVVIKKNIFEKNARSHRDLTAGQSRDIIHNALYNANLYGQNQKASRPYNWIMIHLADKNAAVVVEVNPTKDNIEIINWHYLRDNSLRQKEKQAIKEGGLILNLSNGRPAGNAVNDNLSLSEKQAEREDGQLLILSPENGSAAALSALPSGLSSLKTSSEVANSETRKSLNTFVPSETEHGSQRISALDDAAKVRKKYENPNVSRVNILPEDDIMASGGSASGTTKKPETYEERLTEAKATASKAIDKMAKAVSGMKGKSRGEMAQESIAAQEEARKAVADFIRTGLDSRNMTLFGKRELNRIMGLVENVKSVRMLQNHLTLAERVIADTEIGKQLSAIKDLVRMKKQGKNSRGVSIAKSVDDRTRKIFEYIKGRTDELLVTPIDKDINALNAEIRELAFERKRLEEDAETNAERIAEIDTRIENIKAEKKGLYDRRDELRQQNREDFGGRWKGRFDELTAKLNDEDEALTDAEYDELEALTILNMINDADLMGTTRITDSETGQMSESIQSLVDKQNGLLERNKELRRERHEAKEEDKPMVTRLIEANKDEVMNLDTAINSIKEQQIGKYREARGMLDALVEGGRERLKEELQREKERQGEIARNAYDDVKKGKDWKLYDRQGRAKDLTKREGVEDFAHLLFAANLQSLAYMAQNISNRLSGRGYIYRNFIEGKNGVLAAERDYNQAMRNATDMLNAKTKEMFGKKFNKVAAENRKVYNDSGVFIHDKEGNAQELRMSKGTGMYLRQLWNMKDGRMKLVNMGFTEDSMAQVDNFIGPQLAELADWMVDEYYPQLRERTNERHKEIYHTSMANVDNYVPIRIDKQALKGQSDMVSGAAGSYSESLQKRNGSLVNRTVNVLPIDLSRTAFDVLAEHTNTNEEWIAFARVRQDMDYILNSKAFRNTLNANSRGSYKDFEEAARIALHMPAEQTPSMDRLAIAVSGGYVTGAIAWRQNTAIKQLLSLPAFLAYSQNPIYLAHFTKNLANPIGSFLWIKKNSPIFRKRIEEGLAGSSDIQRELESLNDGMFKSFLTKYAKYGMFSNKLFDAIAYASGAKAVYDFEYPRMKKKFMLEGMSEEEAEKEAHDAALMRGDALANESQQSNVGAYKSAAQVSKTFMGRMMSVFKQAVIGYGRKLVLAGNDLYKVIFKHAETKKHLMEDLGLTGAQAEWDMFNTGRKAAVSMAIFGFFLNWLWDSGNETTAAMLWLTGDGDDDKYEDADKELSLARKMMLYGSYFIQGSPAGTALHDLASMGKYDPISISGKLVYSGKNIHDVYNDYGVSPELIASVTKEAVALRGVDIETLANICIGVQDLVDHGFNENLAINVSFIINDPKSTREMIARSQKEHFMPIEYAEAMAYARKLNGTNPVMNILTGRKTETDKQRAASIEEWMRAEVGKDAYKQFKDASKDGAILSQIGRYWNERNKPTEEFMEKFETEHADIFPQSENINDLRLGIDHLKKYAKAYNQKGDYKKYAEALTLQAELIKRIAYLLDGGDISDDELKNLLKKEEGLYVK